MSSSNAIVNVAPPVIGCTSYRKSFSDQPLTEYVALGSTYIKALVAAGGIPLVIPSGLSEPAMQAILVLVDGLLLPGGGDVDPGEYGDSERHKTLRGVDESRDRLELFMARAAVAQRKPVLAICRGHQVFNVALGGSLWQDVDSQMSGTIGHDHFDGHARNYTPHAVEVSPSSKLAGCLTKTRVHVNSLHHQGIRQLAPGLSATAVAPDGLIEGIEIPDHPFAVGVQWHPEDLIHDDPTMLGLFRKLVEAAIANR